MTPPSISMARFEITSLAFMLDCVPEPVCHTTSGKCSSSLPSITSCAAATIGLAERGIEPAELHVRLGGGALDDAERAHDRSGCFSQPILKLPSERWACAPQYLSAGTSMAPKVSVSTRTLAAEAGLCAVIGALPSPKSSMMQRSPSTAGRRAPLQ